MMQLMSIGIVAIIVLWLFSKFIGKLLSNSILDTFGNQSTPIIFTMITVISLWAVINTNGKTYLLFSVCIVFGILMFSLTQKRSEPSKVEEKRSYILFQLLLIYAVFYFIQLLKVIDISDFTLRALHDDVAYSAGISDFMVKYHKETLILDPNSNYSWQPYHYFELHFSALLSAITGFTSLKLLYLIVYPVFYSLSLLTIKEYLNRIEISVSFGLLLFVYITCSDWGNTWNMVFNVDIFPNVSSINKVGTKLAIYPVIIVGLLNYIKKTLINTFTALEIAENLFFLGLICLFYPTSIPIVLFLAAFTYAYLKTGRYFWKIIIAIISVLLAILFFKSDNMIELVFLTHPIQHLMSYLPLIVLLMILIQKCEFNKLIKLNLNHNFLIIIGTWIFLVLLRFLGQLELYNNPDSAQIYGNFIYIFIFFMVLTVTLYLINELKASRPNFNTVLLSFCMLGFYKNQMGNFLYFPMEKKALPRGLFIPNDKLLVWDRDTADFKVNTSNWLIHFTIPYSNTRWDNPNYFPLLRTLPRPEQVTKITQRYAFESVIKKASNYNNDYFNQKNSILLDDLIKSKTEQN
jgi:hypothetical protein